jgi:hypothetical protein
MLQLLAPLLVVSREHVAIVGVIIGAMMSLIPVPTFIDITLLLLSTQRRLPYFL